MTLILGDCLEAMAEMEPDSVDAVVTDPPYGLGFMGKKWDVMPPGDEVAAAMLRVLKPAHYLLAFGGTRTHHRLMVALENAGFEIRDCLMWLYGSGFPKGKGQLKPAYEPIILCRKPGKGVRALGIDECRIGTGERPAIVGTNKERRWPGDFKQGSYADGTTALGRWPANIVIDEEAGALIDEQSGMSVSRIAPRGGTSPAPMSWGDGRKDGDKPAGHADSGGASRFFYCPKASRSERNAGCVGFEAKNLAGHNKWTDVYYRKDNGEVTPDPQRNHHPTVKPVALMRWLVRLICPPGSTVLDPFMGSGTTGVACATEGREFIGIELEPEYMVIAEARIKHAEKQQLRLVV